VVIAELHRVLNQRLRVQEWLPIGRAAVSVKEFISEAKEELTTSYLVMPLHIHVLHNTAERASIRLFRRL
jgi:hypothetical protein